MKKGHFEGTTAVTVFAVPNKVFDKLPERVKFFLFSPFGTNALKKLLQYHIVPGVVTHSGKFHIVWQSIYHSRIRSFRFLLQSDGRDGILPYA